MRKRSLRDQQGLAQVLVIGLVIVVLAVVGFAVWQVMKKNNTSDNKTESKTATQAVSDAMKQAAAKCDATDKDICKFYSSWKENKYYQVTATTTEGGNTSTYTLESEGSDKTHMTSTNSEYSFDIITIGKTTYTKDTTDNKWWKQTTTTNKDTVTKVEPTFEDPAKDETETTKTVYKKIGKEACGKLTCFKYQVIDPANKDTTEYIWFDDKDYQLRRTLDESATGKTDSTFSYNKVSIKEPSPTKDVPAGKVLIPGSNQLMDMPSMN